MDAEFEGKPDGREIFSSTFCPEDDNDSTSADLIKLVDLNDDFDDDDDDEKEEEEEEEEDGGGDDCRDGIFSVILFCFL